MNPEVRRRAKWTWDAYGNVFRADHIAPHPFMSVGHKGLFVERLDVGVENVSVTGSRGGDTPRLVTFAKTVFHNRNRNYMPSLGRFMQADMNASGMSVGAVPGFHGVPLFNSLMRLHLGDRYGDGANLYTYCRSDPYTFVDPMGLETVEVLSRPIRIGTVRQTSFMGVSYADGRGNFIKGSMMIERTMNIYARQVMRVRVPSRAKNFGGSAAAIGKMIGAIMAWSAFGDRDFFEDRALRDILVGSFVDLVGEFPGALKDALPGAAKRVGMGNDRVNTGIDWGIGAGQVVFGDGNFLAWAAIVGSDIAFAQANAIGYATNEIAKTVSMAFGGIGLFAGYYAGVVEYASERAFDW